MVVDSSVVVAALIDSGPVGRWAEALLLSGPLVAPHLMPVEAANILRRSALAGHVLADVASLAHGELLSLPLELFPYARVHPVCGSCDRISPPTTDGTSRWPRNWDRAWPRSTPG